MTTERAEGQAYYFGTYSRPGHWLWSTSGRKVGSTGYGESFRWDVELPWRRIDGTLNPSQVQGECAVHHRAGWTALAFINRTDDSRPGSNSVFFFEGDLTFAEAVQAAHRRFPWVMRNIKFELKDTADA